MLRQWPQLDVIGGGLTLLCAVHCIVTPILVTSLPFFVSAGFETILSTLLITVASVAIVGGAVQHRRLGALFPYFIGCVLFFGRVLVGPQGSPAELGIAVVASGFFLWGHLLNYRFCRAQVAVHQH